MQGITLLISFHYLCRTVNACCNTISCFNRMGHTARQTQDWLTVNTPDFIQKHEWPPNSPDLNPLDYCVWGLRLTAYKGYTPKPTNKDAQKIPLQTIWDNLSQQSIDKAILAFRKRLRACVKADGGHFEHVL